MHARPSIEKLSEIIESDPATAVKILSVANQSKTGLTGQMVSVAQAIEKLSIDAVSAMGLEFGGVDILVDKAGKGYVLEEMTPATHEDIEAPADARQRIGPVAW